MSRASVVSLCDRTGHMVEPWAEAGYDCLCIDTQHSIRRDQVDGNATYRWGDVRSLTPEDLPENIVAAFAQPPCTHLAVSGARDFATKGLRLLIDALDLVESCRKLLAYTGAPWMIENPVGRLSTCWRKPDHIFNPCDYGGYLDTDEDAYTKKTCLWTGGGFVMPEPKPVVPVYGSKMHLLPNTEDRADIRAITPRGFARAVFLANNPNARREAA